MNIFEAAAKPVAGRIRRPLMGICLCFVLGTIINEYIRAPFVVLSLSTALLMFLSLLTLGRKISSVFLLLGIIFFAAVYSKNYQTPPADHVSRISYSYRKDSVLVEGVVVSDVEPRPFFKGKKTVFILEVKRIRSPWGWKSKRGVVLVNVFRDEGVAYGDRLRLEGKLHRPFNFSGESDFSYRDYLYRKGITFILSVKREGRVEMLGRGQGNPLAELSFRLKHRLVRVLRDHLPKEEAGIMQAFLLGDRYDIPRHVYDLFKLSGVAHIIAISGFNIGIVAYLIFLTLKMFPLPRQAQYILTMGLLVFYAFLTGGQPPVVRATIMAAVFLMSFLVEREQESINTLSAAALALLLMNPLNLFDVGFQLSFISVLFIIVFYPRLMGLFYKWLPGVKEEAEEEGPAEKKGWVFLIKLSVVRFLLRSAAVSLTAYLGVLVLVAYYFRLITPVVILANLVVVPLASLIIFLGMGLLVAGVFCPSIAFTFASCTIVLLNFMVASVLFFSRLPFAYIQLDSFPLWVVFLYYGIFVLIFSWISILKRK